MRMRVDICLTYNNDSDVDQAKKRHLNSGQMQRNHNEERKRSKQECWVERQAITRVDRWGALFVGL